MLFDCICYFCEVDNHDVFIVFLPLYLVKDFYLEFSVVPIFDAFKDIQVLIHLQLSELMQTLLLQVSVQIVVLGLRNQLRLSSLLFIN